MKVNREQLLLILNSVSPGLSTKGIVEQSKGIVEQSNCFVFKDGNVHTFNDETACVRPSTLDKSITGAVAAEKLIEQLQKWPDDEVELSVTDKAMVITAKRKETGLILEADISLPIDQVDVPPKWKKIPDDFAEAAGVVGRCASREEGQVLVYVHISPEWIEGCDNFQLCRWPLKTGVKKSILVKHEAIRHVVGMAATEYAETDGWLHFKAANGLVLSLRRYLEDYPDLSGALDVEGHPVTLPKGLTEACDKAAVFASENSDAHSVAVELKNGRVIIRGDGTSGWFKETKKLTYDGPPLSFRANPDILADLVKKHTDCIVADGKLLVNAGNYKYVLYLYVPDPTPAAEPEPTPEPTPEKPKKKKDKTVPMEATA